MKMAWIRFGRNCAFSGHWRKGISTNSRVSESSTKSDSRGSISAAERAVAGGRVRSNRNAFWGHSDAAQFRHLQHAAEDLWRNLVENTPTFRVRGYPRDVRTAGVLIAEWTFFNDGWWSLVRPSSSHLTTASSSFVRSTVPISPVGLPKFPKPSTRSPGFISWSVERGAPSGGRLARSESAVAPGCGKGGWGGLRSLGVDLLLMRAIFVASGRKRPAGDLFRIIFC